MSRSGKCYKSCNRSPSQCSVQCWISPFIPPRPIQFTPPSPTSGPLSITKTSNVSTLPVFGQTVTYTYIVRNGGPIALLNVSLVDSVIGPIGFVGSLASGANVNFSAVYRVRIEDLERGFIINIATVTATGGGQVFQAQTSLRIPPL